MTDKDEEVVEQEEQSSPATEKSPEVETKESPPEEVDKDFAEWAGNKGFDEEQLKNPDVSKALNMARNAEKFVGKKRTEEQEESADEEMDKYLEEILGGAVTPQDAKKLVEEASNLDISKLSPEEKQVFEAIKGEARKAALDEIAPIKSQLQRQQIKSEYAKLEKEYGDNFTKNAKEILVKVRDNPGISLDDAAKSVLLDKLLKKQLNEGIIKGKEIKKKEMSEKTEAVKKTETKTLSDEWKDLSLAEQEKILIDLQKKG